MKLCTILAVFVAAVSHATAADIYLSASGGSCSNALQLNDWSFSCGGDQYCAPGDGAEAEVEATLTSDLESDSLCADLDASITLISLSVYTKNVAQNKAVSICDYADSDSCPAAGTYNFEVGGIPIPPFNPSNWMNLLGGKAKLKLYQSDCTTQIASCEFNISTSTSAGSTTMIVGTSFAMVSLLGAAFFVRQRRRTVKTESDENGHGFELMGEADRQRSGVAV